MRETTSGIRRHPLRAFLIFLTYAVGFSSIVSTISVVEGGKRSLEHDLNSLGIDVIAIFNKPTLLSMIGVERAIEDRHVRELSTKLGDLAHQVIAGRIEPAHLAAPDSRPQVATLVATEPGFEQILRAGTLAGRFFAKGEELADGAVPAVLDEALARRFDRENPAALVGRELTLTRGGKSERARILGVMRDPILLRRHFDLQDAQSSSRAITARRLEFKNIYVPYRAGEDAITGLIVQVGDIAKTDAAAAAVESFFADAKLEPYIFVQKHWIERMVQIVDRFQLASHFIWLLNLAVVLVLTGTITMLAVEERFFEASLRRVEGASIADVVLPILGEGVLLAACALPVGFFISSALLSAYVVPVLGWEPSFPGTLAWIVPVLIGAGAIANLLPAWRVASLEPALVLAERGEP